MILEYRASQPGQRVIQWEPRDQLHLEQLAPNGEWRYSLSVEQNDEDACGRICKNSAKIHRQRPWIGYFIYSSIGFEVDHNDGSFAMVKAKGVVLHINHDFDSGPSHHVQWIEVKGIDALYERCQESQGRMCSAITSQPWGFREFHSRDPFNNLLIFAESVATQDTKSIEATSRLNVMTIIACLRDVQTASRQLNVLNARLTNVAAGMQFTQSLAGFNNDSMHLLQASIVYHKIPNGETLPLQQAYDSIHMR